MQISKFVVLHCKNDITISYIHKIYQSIEQCNEFENSIELLYLCCLTIEKSEIECVKLINLIVKFEEKLLINLNESNQDSLLKLRSPKLIKLLDELLLLILSSLKKDKDAFSFSSSTKLRELFKLIFSSLERITRHFNSGEYFPEFLKILDNKSSCNILLNFLEANSVIIKVGLFLVSYFV